MFHLNRIGPPATKAGVVNVMDFDKVTSLIGRNKCQVDFVLDSSNHVSSQYISRLHARVVRQENNSHRLFDDSLNGIFINNTKIMGSVVLQEGDIVTFGHPYGVKLKPGVWARQPDSEYQFIFERCTCEKATPNSTLAKPTILEDRLNTHPSVFKKPPEMSPRVLSSHKDCKSKLSSTMNNDQTILTYPTSPTLTPSSKNDVSLSSATISSNTVSQSSSYEGLSTEKNVFSDQKDNQENQHDLSSPDLNETMALVEASSIINKCMTTIAGMTKALISSSCDSLNGSDSTLKSYGLATGSCHVKDIEQRDESQIKDLELPSSRLNELSLDETKVLENSSDRLLVDESFKHAEKETSDSNFSVPATSGKETDVSPVTTVSSPSSLSELVLSSSSSSSSTSSFSSSISAVSCFIATSFSTTSTVSVSSIPSHSVSSVPAFTSGLLSLPLPQSSSSCLISPVIPSPQTKFDSSLMLKCSSSTFCTKTLPKCGIITSDNPSEKDGTSTLKCLSPTPCTKSHSRSCDIFTRNSSEADGRVFLAPTTPVSIHSSSSTTENISDRIGSEKAAPKASLEEEKIEQHSGTKTSLNNGNQLSKDQPSTSYSMNDNDKYKRKYADNISPSVSKSKNVTSPALKACDIHNPGILSTSLPYVGCVTRGRKRKQKQVCSCCLSDSTPKSKKSSFDSTPSSMSSSKVKKTKRTSGNSKRASTDDPNDSDVVYLLSESNGVICISDDDGDDLPSSKTIKGNNDNSLDLAVSHEVCITSNENTGLEGIIVVNSDEGELNNERIDSSSSRVSSYSEGQMAVNDTSELLRDDALIASDASISLVLDDQELEEEKNMTPSTVPVNTLNKLMPEQKLPSSSVQGNESDVLALIAGRAETEYQQKAVTELQCNLLQNEQETDDKSNVEIKSSDKERDFKTEIGSDSISNIEDSAIAADKKLEVKYKTKHHTGVECKASMSFQTSDRNCHQGRDDICFSSVAFEFETVKESEDLRENDGKFMEERNGVKSEEDNNDMTVCSRRDDLSHHDILAISVSRPNVHLPEGNISSPKVATGDVKTHCYIASDIEGGNFSTCIGDEDLTPKAQDDVMRGNDNSSNSALIQDDVKIQDGVTLHVQDDVLLHEQDGVTLQAQDDDVTPQIQVDVVTSLMQDDVTPQLQDNNVTLQIIDHDVRPYIQDNVVTPQIQHDVTPELQDNVILHEQDDTSLHVQYDVTSQEQDDVTLHEQDDVTLHEQDDVTLHEQDDVPLQMQDDDDVTPQIQDVVVTPIIQVQADVTPQLQDDDVTLHEQEDDDTLPKIKDGDVTPQKQDDVTPHEQDDVTLQMQDDDDDVTPQLQDDDVTSREQEDDDTLPKIKDGDVTPQKQDDVTPHEQDDVTLQMQDDDGVTPQIQDVVITPIIQVQDDITPQLQDDDVTSHEQENDDTLPKIKDGDVTPQKQDDVTPHEQDDVILHEQDDVTLQIHCDDDEVTPQIQDNGVSPQVQDDVTSLLQDGDVTSHEKDDATLHEQDDVTSQIQDNDDTSPQVQDDVVTPEIQDDVTKQLQDDDITSQIKDDATPQKQDDAIRHEQDVALQMQCDDDEVTPQIQDSVTSQLQDDDVTMHEQDDVTLQIQVHNDITPQVQDDVVTPKVQDDVTTQLQDDDIAPPPQLQDDDVTPQMQDDDVTTQLHDQDITTKVQDYIVTPQLHDEDDTPETRLDDAAQYEVNGDTTSVIQDDVEEQFQDVNDVTILQNGVDKMQEIPDENCHRAMPLPCGFHKEIFENEESETNFAEATFITSTPADKIISTGSISTVSNNQISPILSKAAIDDCSVSSKQGFNNLLLPLYISEEENSTKVFECKLQRNGFSNVNQEQFFGEGDCEKGDVKKEVEMNETERCSYVVSGVETDKEATDLPQSCGFKKKEDDRQASSSQSIAAEPTDSEGKPFTESDNSNSLVEILHTEGKTPALSHNETIKIKGLVTQRLESKHESSDEDYDIDGDTEAERQQNALEKEKWADQKLKRMTIEEELDECEEVRDLLFSESQEFGVIENQSERFKGSEPGQDQESQIIKGGIETKAGFDKDKTDEMKLLAYVSSASTSTTEVCNKEAKEISKEHIVLPQSNDFEKEEENQQPSSPLSDAAVLTIGVVESISMESNSNELKFALSEPKTPPTVSNNEGFEYQNNAQRLEKATSDVESEEEDFDSNEETEADTVHT